jgi:hypothetical protein
MSGAWTRKEGKSPSGGLNEKGRKSYERENPGSDLKAPSKEAGNPRRASFCARMSGMKKKLTSSKTANDPDSRINKSLKAWNCSAREDLNTILFKKKSKPYYDKRDLDPKKKPVGKKKCADCGETPCECHAYSAREELEVIRFGGGAQISKLVSAIERRATLNPKMAGSADKFLQDVGQNPMHLPTARIYKGTTPQDTSSAIDRIAGSKRPLSEYRDQPYHRRALARSVKDWRGGGYENPSLMKKWDWDTKPPGAAFSARDQLNTILMAADTRPRDPMGRFDQAEDGAPNPQHMKIVYAAPQEQAPPAITGKNMGKLAAGGAAFMGGGMALQHLIEKLKKLKK